MLFLQKRTLSRKACSSSMFLPGPQTKLEVPKTYLPPPVGRRKTSELGFQHPEPQHLSTGRDLHSPRLQGRPARCGRDIELRSSSGKAWVGGPPKRSSTEPRPLATDERASPTNLRPQKELHLTADLRPHPSSRGKSPSHSRFNPAHIR